VAVDRFARLAELGVALALVDLPYPEDRGVFDFLAEVARAVAPLGAGMLTPAAASKTREFNGSEEKGG
jgi:hypothetical protein